MLDHVGGKPVMRGGGVLFELRGVNQLVLDNIGGKAVVMRGGGSELRGVNLVEVRLVCHCVRANEHLSYIFIHT